MSTLLSKSIFKLHIEILDFFPYHSQTDYRENLSVLGYPNVHYDQSHNDILISITYWAKWCIGQYRWVQNRPRCLVWCCYLWSRWIVVQRSFGLPPYATVFQAALVAIMKVLELCGSLHESFSVLNVSMSSLMALSNPSCQDMLFAGIHELRAGLEVKGYLVKFRVRCPW